MTQHQNVQPELSEIADLLASGCLPDEVQKSGERLLRRIKSPVRVAILGLVGSGKSELLNFLAGKKILSPKSKFSAFELAFGLTTKCLVTDQQGAINELPGLDLEKIAETAPVFVSAETDLPGLKNTSFLEVALEGSIENQCAAMDWAARRADIVIWCSQGFSQEEQLLWSRVPDNLKDHSFFVLNHADTLTSQGMFEDRLSALQSIVADEFHSLFPIATTQAMAAISNTDRKDQDMLNASGGAALKQAILKEVKMGRRADQDSALVFLSRYGGSAKSKSKPRLKPTLERNLPKPEVPQTTAKPATSPVVDASPKLDQNVNVIAFEYLQQRAMNLGNMSGELDPSDILTQCCDISSHLADMYTDAATEQSDLYEDFLDAAEVLILMQLEEGEGPAADAITLLLQLKRGLQQNLAA